MSPVDGGPTRFKGRKQRQGGGTDPTDETLRRIHSTREISGQDIIQLYHLDKPVCSGCRGNLKDSPNCFCGLIPPPAGSRKQGLWRKLSDILEELGPDPAESLRTSPNIPSGLTNLGATCYVNSVLQCLFMNTSFRNGVFSAESELAQHQPVLHQLSRLFAQLHSGKKSAVDSAPFANTLELDNAVQQDGQEFLKLLLTLLERVLGLSKNAEARNVVQSIFRGTFSYVTKCSECGQESDASKDAVDFYELELNVKGFSSLDESLRNYLSEEHLQGENQYKCESCQKRVDATHSTKLRSIPPVLNFQLKRFVFNAKTATKKKVTSKFSFPRSLDMSGHLSANSVEEETSVSALYDLSAILVHKGSMVNSGHYVAHIKDERTGEWWRFDDEQVTSLGSHPLGESSGAPVTQEAASHRDLPTKQPDGGVENNGADQSLRGVGLERSNLESSPRGSANKDSSILTSADAYMLMYSRRGQLGSWGQEFVTRTSQTGARDAGNALQAQNVILPEFELPEHYRAEVEEMNTDFESARHNYSQRKQEEQSRITERRVEVRGVLAEAPVTQWEDFFFWISSDWLRLWADTLEPLPQIRNAPFLCQHQKLPPNKVQFYKRISESAWNRLFLKYSGGPVLSERDHCVECIYADAKVAASADSYRDQRAYMRELVDEVLSGRTELDGTQFFVSRTWLLQWARRKAAGAPSEADANPTAALVCQHGSLLPEQAPGARRQLIPQRAWEYFQHNAEQVQGADPMGYQSFADDLESCDTCQSDFDKVASKREGLRATKLEQRMKHDALYSGRGLVVSPGATYYLVPSLWLSRWRAYLGASGKNLLAVEEPDGLEGLILSLLCSKHEGMLFKPPTLARTRKGELMQSPGHEDVFTVVTKEDWTNLCHQWDIDPKKGIQACLDRSSEVIPTEGMDVDVIARNGFVEDSSVCQGSLRDMAVGGNLGSQNPEAHEDIDCTPEGIPALQTTPEVCQECVEEREVHELHNKLHFTSGEISVDLVVGKGPPPSLLAANRVVESERRTSKRARRASAQSGGRVLLKVSGETTVFQLKLQIWESLSIVRENQKVHFGKIELVDESATLADLNILPGSQLWVMDSGQHENRDIAEELPAADSGRAETEEGFRGTRLMMGLPDAVEPLIGMEQVAAALHRSELNEREQAKAAEKLFDSHSSQIGNEIPEENANIDVQNGRASFAVPRGEVSLHESSDGKEEGNSEEAGTVESESRASHDMETLPPSVNAATGEQGPTLDGKPSLPLLDGKPTLNLDCKGTVLRESSAHSPKKGYDNFMKT